MKPGGHKSIRSALVLILSFAATPASFAPAAEPPATCAASHIEYDTAALEKIVRTPAEVLGDEEGFWKNEPAQLYTVAWAESVGVTISREKWRRQIEALVESGTERRGRFE